MKNTVLLLSCVVFFFLLFSCNEDEKSAHTIALVPTQSYSQDDSGGWLSFLHINGGAYFSDLAGSHDILNWLDSDTGLELMIHSDPSFKDEEFELQIANEGISITSASRKGSVNALSSIAQLVVKYDKGYKLPLVTIREAPVYEYRGMMLDVARNFFSAREIESLLPYLWLFKINHLHLHLTDDQGWRIEIPGHPELTDIGASVSVSGERSGFMSVQEYMDLQKKAALFGITIVPEIDLPGHTNAFLTAYPEFAPKRYNVEPYTGIEVGFSSLNFDNPELLPVIKDILAKLSDMTIGPYIHIGGDEAKSTSERDYRAFINEIADFVSAEGKLVMGWEEMGSADLTVEHIAQVWKGETMRDLKKNDSKVVLSPSNYAYLDMKYNNFTKLGQNWAGLIDFEKSISWNPLDYASHLDPENIIGVEYPLWTETIENMEDVYYMVFPRICSASEIGWNGDIEGDFAKFELKVEYLFEKSGINRKKSNGYW